MYIGECPGINSVYQLWMLRQYLQKEDPNRPYQAGDQIPQRLTDEALLQLGIPRATSIRVVLNDKFPRAVVNDERQ